MTKAKTTVLKFTASDGFKHYAGAYGAVKNGESLEVPVKEGERLLDSFPNHFHDPKESDGPKPLPAPKAGPASPGNNPRVEVRNDSEVDMCSPEFMEGVTGIPLTDCAKFLARATIKVTAEQGRRLILKHLTVEAEVAAGGDPANHTPDED